MGVALARYGAFKAFADVAEAGQVMRDTCLRQGMSEHQIVKYMNKNFQFGNQQCMMGVIAAATAGAAAGIEFPSWSINGRGKILKTQTITKPWTIFWVHAQVA